MRWVFTERRCDQVLGRTPIRIFSEGAERPRPDPREAARYPRRPCATANCCLKVLSSRREVRLSFLLRASSSASWPVSSAFSRVRVATDSSRAASCNSSSLIICSGDALLLSIRRLQRDNHRPETRRRGPTPANSTTPHCATGRLTGPKPRETRCHSYCQAHHQAGGCGGASAVRQVGLVEPAFMQAPGPDTTLQVSTD